MNPIEPSESDAILSTLLDQQAIRDVLARYCRGLDRMDREMAYSVWHPAGTAFYDGIFEGMGHAFVDWVFEVHASMERHSHQISNTLIQLSGDRAMSEACVTVVLWTLPDAEGRKMEMIGRGRYLDRWERRDRIWAIEHRTYLLDMQTLAVLDRGAVSEGSHRDERDLSYEFINRY